MDSNDRERDDLNLDQAEFDEAPAGPPSCAVCSEELFGTYYEINGVATCERCRYGVEEESRAASPAGRFFRALMAGAGAGVLGGGIWFAVQELTGYQVGLVAIVVGWLVGKAVRWGCNARGGWVYQGMAVTLTYFAIVLTFVPQIVSEIQNAEFGQIEQPATVDGDAMPRAAEQVAGVAPSEEQPVTDDSGAGSSPAAEGLDAEPTAQGAPVFDDEVIPELHPVVGLLLGVAVLVAIAAVAPFFGGSIMGIIIIGIGLYEAWRQNKKMVFTIEGPFQMGTRPPGGMAEDGAPAAIEP